MNITSGGLSFDFTATNDNLKKVIQESQKEIQGLADASKQGGKVMDAAFKSASERMAQHAATVKEAMGKSIEEIIRLEEEITKLKGDADKAFSAGKDDEYNRIKNLIAAKEEELKKHRDVTNACEEANDAIARMNERLAAEKEAAEKAARSQESLRSQLRRAREELARLEAAEGPGVRQTERFRALQEEAGALADALSDALQQVSVFSDDNASISGALEGLGGLAGAFSAAQGAMGLFGLENEKVQQAMLKVQSAIAITTGIQQVANALNKDSAFQLVIVRKAKEKLAMAETKLATALGVSTVAARVFMATITLGLSAAIGAIIYVIDKFRTAAAEGEAFNKKVAESAAEPVGKVELLAEKWKRLGDDMAAKKRFIEDNKKAFDDLGVSIKNVADAENLLINNKDAFIQAQIEKAKAAIYIEQQKEAIEELIKAESKLPEQIQKTEEARQRALDHLEKNGYDAYFTPYTETHKISKEQAIKNINEACDAQIQAYNNKLDEMRDGISAGYRQAADAEEKGLKIMKDAAIEASKDGEEAADAFTTYVLEGTQRAEQNLNAFGAKVNNYFDGLINNLQASSNSFANFFGDLLGKLFKAPDGDLVGDGTIGDRIDKVKAKYDEAVKKLADLRKRTSTATAQDIQEAEKEVQKYADLYKTLSGVTLGAASTPAPTGGKKTAAELYAQEIADKKALYSKYLAWVTSSDATVRVAAKSAFADLLKEGSTYLAYLQKERDAISQKATKTALDLQKLQMLNNEIAEATKDAVLTDFQKQLEADLKACNTLGAMLGIIEQRRQAIAGDNTEVGDKEREILKAAEDDTKKQMEDETNDLLRTYAGYEVERYRFAQAYARKHQLLARDVARTQQALLDQTAVASKLTIATTRDAAQAITGLTVKTVGQIDALITDLQKRRLSVGNLDEAETAMLDELRHLKETIAKDDPFEALRKNLATLKAAFSSGSLDKNDPFVKKLQERKVKYQEFNEAMLGADEAVAAAVRQQYADLLRQGASFTESLQAQLAALEKKRVTIGLDVDEEAMAAKIEAVLISETGTAKTVAADVQARLQEITQTLGGVSSALTSATAAAEKNGLTISGEMKTLLVSINALLDAATEGVTRMGDGANESVTGLAGAVRSIGAAIASIKGIDARSLLDTDELGTLIATAAGMMNATAQDATQTITGLADKTSSQIDAIIAQLESKRVSGISLDEAETAMLDELRHLKETIAEDDPFEAIRKSLATLKAAFSSGSLDTADPFIEQLKERKAEYEKFGREIEGADADVAAAIRQQYAGLLRDGATFTESLRRQIDALDNKRITVGLDVDEETMASKLEAVLIAETGTAQAVAADVQAKLREISQTLGSVTEALTTATAAAEKNGIAVSGEMKQLLTDILTITGAATEGVARMGDGATQGMTGLTGTCQNIGTAIAAIKDLGADGLIDTGALEAQLSIAQRAIQGLEIEQAKYSKQVSQEYATLLEHYKTHQQQLSDIQKKYAKERETAAKEGNIGIIQLIDKEEQEEISKLASAQLMASETWGKLFGDISKLGTSTITRLIKEVEAHKIRMSAELNPADLKAVEGQLARARQELQQRNPFLALRDGLDELRRAMNEKKLLSDTSDPILQELEHKKKTYETIAANLADPKTAPSVAIDFKTTLDGGADFQTYLRRRIMELEGQKVKLGVEFTGQHELDVLIAMLNKVQGTGKSTGESFKEVFGSVGSSIEFIAGSFDAVVNGMKKMGIQMDEETESILGDIGGILEGAQGIASGIASGNSLSIIQGSISLFSSAFDLFNTRDRRAQASIKKHEEALGRLRNAYTGLQHAIKRSLGEETYQNQTALIANLRKQQAEVNGMMRDELSKKHSDADKVDEYREQYKELGRQIIDIMDEITDSITQTSAKDLAGQLADALTDAFEGGKDAAKAFGEVADDVIRKAVVNALKLQLLEKPLQNAIKQLQRDMGFNEEGAGTFDGLTEDEQKRFKDAIQAAGANFQAAMDMYKGLFEQLDDSDPTTLSGAIKGASQESIDLLAGQTNAVRQNQVTSLSLLRQQLLHLSNIDANTGVIAGRLLQILNHITTPSGSSLRSQGITD